MVHRDVVLVQVPVHHAGGELPQGGVLHGLLPAAQQLAGDLTGGGGAVEVVEHALAALLGAVGGQVRVHHERAGQRVQRTQGPADLHGNRRARRGTRGRSVQGRLGVGVLPL